MGTLRSIVTGQFQFQASAAIDLDGDRTGEFGSLRELSGATALRAAELADRERLDPAILPASYGELEVDAFDEGVLLRSGYVFKLFLPGPKVDGRIPGHAEAAESETRLPSADVDDAETFYCIYAWPVSSGYTGRSAFFVNQEGDVLRFTNEEDVYEGTSDPDKIPRFDAALSEPGDMGSVLGVDGRQSVDGHAWVMYGN